MKEIDLDKIFLELKQDVSTALEQTSKDVMKEGLARVKNTSPKRTGVYSKSWGQSKSGDMLVLHNKKRPGLTHLLENGHALRNGGRTKPQPHIAKVQEFVNKEVERRIESELEKHL